MIFLLAAASRAALFALASSFLAVVAFAAGNALLLSVACSIQYRQWSPLFWYSQNSVPERAFYGTEYAFGAPKGFLWYATRFQRRAVLKTGFYGTEGIFGTGNPLLWYGSDTRAGPRFEDAAECGLRFEDATIIGAVPVVAAMDLLA